MKEDIIRPICSSCGRYFQVNYGDFGKRRCPFCKKGFGPDVYRPSNALDRGLEASLDEVERAAMGTAFSSVADSTDGTSLLPSVDVEGEAPNPDEMAA